MAGKKTKSKSADEPYSAKQFFLEDYGRTLFPLTTNRVLVEHGDDKIREYFDKLIEDNLAFLPQKRVYAAKDALHFRRTVKLDPVAEFFLYDLIYKNRALFRLPHVKSRTHFGYRFEGGKPIPASRSYTDFKAAVWSTNKKFKYFVGFDIVSYFNHIYHHDLVEWFAARNASERDVSAFGKFFREANAGRTLDCLPHGLYPAKMIGNDFLRFIEDSHAIKSRTLLRFMDDFYLFSDDENQLRADLAEVQRLLGQKGLSINAGKTTTERPRTEKAESDVDELKKKLLQRRRKIVTQGPYDEDADDSARTKKALQLSKSELNYIIGLLRSGDLEEDDAELILTVMRRHTEDVENHLPMIMRQFPHLSKNVARFCADVPDKRLVARFVLDVATNGVLAQEYQLFWFGVMLEEYLISTGEAAELIRVLFNHPNATDISKAKILEISDQRYGLPELRNEYLTTGQSDWLSWSSAVGSRNMKPAARNYRLTYFKNSSEINKVIGEIVGRL